MKVERFDFEYLSEEGLIKSVHPSGEYMRFAQHAAAMAEKDRELSDTKAALAAVRAQLEADPQVREFERQALEEAQARLAALEWNPITPENLPQCGDEVWNRHSGEAEKLTTHTPPFDANDYASWGYTHFRKTLIPTPAAPSQTGQTTPSTSAGSQAGAANKRPPASSKE